MESSVALAARADTDLDAELARLATATGQSKPSFMNEQQVLAEVEEGEQALKEARTLDHATVVAAFNRTLRLTRDGKGGFHRPFALAIVRSQTAAMA